MRIVVASAYVPFRHDRNARLVKELAATLRKRGHLVDTVLLPYQPIDADPVEQALAFRLLDLRECSGTRIDRLIALGEPAHALRHSHKTLWAVGSCRGTPRGMERSDSKYRSEARKVFHATHAPAHHPGLPVLYPPLLDTTGLDPADPRPEFVWAASMCTDARPDLLLEAMQFVRPDCRLVMMPDRLLPPQAAALRHKIEGWGLGSRIELVPNPSPPERRERLRHALGCLAVGIDQEAPEDAIVEAFHARVPVLTVADSGAPRGMIANGHDGIVVEPDPRLLAIAMNRLAGEPSYRRALGEKAFHSLEVQGISWAHVAEKLVA